MAGKNVSFLRPGLCMVRPRWPQGVTSSEEAHTDIPRGRGLENGCRSSLSVSIMETSQPVAFQYLGISPLFESSCLFVPIHDDKKKT